MSPHAFIPSLRPTQQRMLFIRTRRSWWQRLRPTVVFAAIALAIAGLVLATTWVIGHMHATEAQLQAAHAAGMAAGMTVCPER